MEGYILKNKDNNTLQLFIGDFSQGVKVGKGVEYLLYLDNVLETKNRRVGTYKAGKPHGYFEYYNNGDIKLCNYREGLLHGPCKHIVSQSGNEVASLAMYNKGALGLNVTTEVRNRISIVDFGHHKQKYMCFEHMCYEIIESNESRELESTRGLYSKIFFH